MERDRILENHGSHSPKLGAWYISIHGFFIPWAWRWPVSRQRNTLTRWQVLPHFTRSFCQTRVGSRGCLLVWREREREREREPPAFCGHLGKRCVWCTVWDCPVPLAQMSASFSSVNITGSMQVPSLAVLGLGAEGTVLGELLGLPEGGQCWSCSGRIQPVPDSSNRLQPVPANSTLFQPVPEHRQPSAMGAMPQVRCLSSSPQAVRRAEKHLWAASGDKWGVLEDVPGAALSWGSCALWGEVAAGAEPRGGRRCRQVLLCAGPWCLCHGRRGAGNEGME